MRTGKIGDWKSIRSTFGNDHDFLESIFSVKMFPHIDSPILPLFPPLTGHPRQIFLLTAKALIARRDPIWKIKGKTRFFYILMSNDNKYCEIYFGSLVNGKLEADLVIGSKQEKLTQELLIQMHTVLEQNSFDLQTPVRARKPIHKTRMVLTN